MLFLLFALRGEATLVECRLRKSVGLCDCWRLRECIERRVIDDSV